MAGINSPGLFWEQLNLILVGQLLPLPPPPPPTLVKTDLSKDGVPIFYISFHHHNHIYHHNMETHQEN